MVLLSYRSVYSVYKCVDFAYIFILLLQIGCGQSTKCHFGIVVIISLTKIKCLNGIIVFYLYVRILPEIQQGSNVNVLITVLVIKINLPCNSCLSFTYTVAAEHPSSLPSVQSCFRGSL